MPVVGALLPEIDMPPVAAADFIPVLLAAVVVFFIFPDSLIA